MRDDVYLGDKVKELFNLINHRYARSLFLASNTIQLLGYHSKSKSDSANFIFCSQLNKFKGMGYNVWQPFASFEDVCTKYHLVWQWPG